MAGIGFTLRKLVDRNDLSGAFQAFFHATLYTSGPWILTIIALGMINLTMQPIFKALEDFQSILLFNFCFSFVFTAPFINVTTRKVSDAIFLKDFTPVVGSLLLALGLYYAITLPLISLFYVGFTTLSLGTAYMATVNFALLSGVWIASLYISALKDYKSVTMSFMIGLLTSVVLTMFFYNRNTAFNMLMGFNTGIAVTFTSFVALVYVEYPPVIEGLKGSLFAYRKYVRVGLGGLLYSVAVWIDKWIMWFSPDAYTYSSGITTCPLYDSAMFFAYISVIPSMALFMLAYETAFFEDFVNYYQGIINHNNLGQIENNYNKLIYSVGLHARNTIIVQGMITGSLFVLTPLILEYIPGLSTLQIGIFRFGLIGAALQTFTLFMTILLYYFDERVKPLIINGVYLVLNGVLTFVFMRWGLAFYGMGFFLANILTFVFAAYTVGKYMESLTYHSFITNNPSI